MESWMVEDNMVMRYEYVLRQIARKAICVRGLPYPSGTFEQPPWSRS